MWCRNFVPLALLWIEAFLETVGFTVRELLLDRVSLLLLTVVSGLGVLLCLLQIKNLSSKKKLIFLILASIYGLIGFALHHRFNLSIVKWCNNWVERFRNLHLVGKTIGILLVLVGFVYLTNFIEEYHGWNGFALAFYFCCYLHLTTVVKLLGWEDIFSASDSIMAVTITMFVNFPKDKKRGWQPFVVFGCAFFLLLFKISRPVTEMVHRPVIEREMKELAGEMAFKLVKEIENEPLSEITDEVRRDRWNKLMMMFSEETDQLLE